MLQTSQWVKGSMESESQQLARASIMTENVVIENSAVSDCEVPPMYHSPLFLLSHLHGCEGETSET